MVIQLTEKEAYEYIGYLYKKNKKLQTKLDNLDQHDENIKEEFKVEIVCAVLDLLNLDEAVYNEIRVNAVIDHWYEVLKISE